MRQSHVCVCVCMCVRGHAAAGVMCPSLSLSPPFLQLSSGSFPNAFPFEQTPCFFLFAAHTSFHPSNLFHHSFLLLLFSCCCCFSFQLLHSLCLFCFLCMRVCFILCSSASNTVSVSYLLSLSLYLLSASLSSLFLLFFFIFSHSFLSCTDSRESI